MSDLSSYYTYLRSTRQSQSVIYCEYIGRNKFDDNEVFSLIEHTRPVKSVPLQDVHIESGFWGARQATNTARTIPAIHHQLDITGRLDAWRLDWQPGKQ